MRIFIVGAGEVGFHIASSLVREGHDLVIIERDPEKVRRLEATLDVLAVEGDGCNAEILRSKGIDGADLLFAVSNDDAANLLSALTARRLGAKHCVVRVGRPFHGANPFITEDPDIVPLYPERLVAEEIQSLIRVPGTTKARFFAQGRLVFLNARPSDKADIYDRPLKDMKGPEGWLLVGLRRGATITIPRGDVRLQRGQPLYAVGRSDRLQEFLDAIGVESRPTRRVLIGGGGQVGIWLAKLLTVERIQVTVIQRGRDRAFEAAAQVPEALVLKGDASDPAMLREGGVEEADYFVAATQDDETNILSSLLARELGAWSTVALYQRPEFLNVLRAARVELALSPRMVVAGTILRMVHRREVLSLDLLEGGDAEVVEFEVPPRARVLRRPLHDLGFPREAIVGAVIRGDEIHVPRGSFTFLEGDRVLVFTMADALPELEQIFRGR